MGGVDDDAVHDAGGAEAHDGMIMPVLAPAPGLPAVVDLALVTERAGSEDGRSRQDQVLLLGEELVTGGYNAPAQLPGCQVGQRGESG
jgi:hypothetical protein